MTKTAETQKARDEAIGIVEYYQDKGYDVQRKVIRGTGIDYWEIFDGETGEILKGRITYHREDRGPQVNWI